MRASVFGRQKRKKKQIQNVMEERAHKLGTGTTTTTIYIYIGYTSLFEKKPKQIKMQSTQMGTHLKCMRERERVQWGLKCSSHRGAPLKDTTPKILV